MKMMQRFYEDDIRPKLATVGGNLILHWTCPRCYNRQLVALKLEDLLAPGIRIKCNNIDICVEGLVKFDILAVIENGFYERRSDTPLKKDRQEFA